MKIVDCDSHYLPPGIYDGILYELQTLLPKFTFDQDRKLTDVIVGNDPSNIPIDFSFNLHNDSPGLCDIPSRINDFSKLKITQQLLLPQELAMRFNYTVDPSLGVEMCKSWNRKVKQVIDQNNEFFALAMLPLQDFNEALKEYEWARDNGFKGILIDNVYPDINVGAIPITSLPNIEELFRLCEQDNMVMYFHHMMHNLFAYPDSYLSIRWALPNDIEISICSLIASQYLDLYPNIKIVFSEGADKFVPIVYRKMEIEFLSRRFKSKFTKHPKEYFTNNIYITLDIEKQESFQFMLENFGSQNMLFSTDYPHNDSSGMNKLKDVDDLLALNLPKQDFENIAFRNAEKLFRL